MTEGGIFPLTIILSLLTAQPIRTFVFQNAEVKFTTEEVGNGESFAGEILWQHGVLD